MEPPTFLSFDQVLALHRRQLERYGGIDGVRDPALLDAALNMPRQQAFGECLHDGVPAMAAAYLFHLAKNHPFLDGNKRVAAHAALVFATYNGHVPDRITEDDLERVTLAVAAGEMNKAELTAWMRSQLRDSDD